MPEKSEPTAEEVAAALKEHDGACDRVAVLAKHPFLAEHLNKRSRQDAVKPAAQPQ